MSISKIYINGKFLTQQKTGVQAYALGFLDALNRRNISFEVLMPDSSWQSDRFIVKKIGFFTNSHFWEQISLPYFISKQPGCILVNLCNSAPLFCKNQVITIHDLAFERKGVNWFSKKFKLWYRFLIPRVAKSAKCIFTVSEFSKHEISKYYNIKSNRIKVLVNGLKQNIKISERLINENYLLLIGNGNTRKNTSFVLNNISEIEKLGFKVVVITNKLKIFKTNENIVHKSIIYKNYVNDEDYFSLIKYSKGLIYPSLYEGFGIPILEALTLNVPVICSDLPVFRESFMDLPIYFKLNDSVDLIKAIEKIKEVNISDSDVDELKQKFSFDETVSLFLNTLKEL